MKFILFDANPCIIANTRNLLSNSIIHDPARIDFKQEAKQYKKELKTKPNQNIKQNKQNKQTTQKYKQNKRQNEKTKPTSQGNEYHI